MTSDHILEKPFLYTSSVRRFPLYSTFLSLSFSPSHSSIWCVPFFPSLNSKSQFFFPSSFPSRCFSNKDLRKLIFILYLYSELQGFAAVAGICKSDLLDNTNLSDFSRWSFFQRVDWIHLFLKFFTMGLNLINSFTLIRLWAE